MSIFFENIIGLFMKYHISYKFDYIDGTFVLYSTNWFIPKGETEAIPIWSIRDSTEYCPCAISTLVMDEVAYSKPYKNENYFVNSAINIDAVFITQKEQGGIAGEVIE